MELTTTSYGIITSIILGVIFLFCANKQRDEDGEWSSALQWGYLLLMVGIFAFLSETMAWSFTAVLLTFTLTTGVIWVWAKLTHRNKNIADNNHFRDYMSGFFPIIAVVFILRTFVTEPFQIPSSSMRPGLVKGDFILVNKFAYGIRIPLLNTVAITTGKIARGDVVVFNFPVEPQTNYIKRIVAVGGDVIEYKDKILTVNGIVEKDNPMGNYQYTDDIQPTVTRQAQRFQAAFGNRNFEVLKVNNTPSVDANTFMYYQQKMHNQGFESGLSTNCEYAQDGSGFRCKVPEGQYFAMGDNRDNSADSRYWGFVDDKLIVGKAFFIWMNFGEMSRIGSIIQ